MSSHPNSTELTNLDLPTTPERTPALVPPAGRRPFVKPKLVKQGKVATLTGFEGGGSGFEPN